MPAASRSPRAARDPSATEAAGALLLALPQVMDAFRGVMRRQLDPALSVPQFRALRFIAQARDASVSELAAFLGVTLNANDTIDFAINSGSAIVYGAVTDNTTQDPTLHYAKPAF